VNVTAKDWFSVVLPNKQPADVHQPTGQVNTQYLCISS